MKKSSIFRKARGFAGTLLEWHRTRNNRQMPWKGEKDPYRIWLSEIILQQTRVEQGLAYYNRFVSTFPDIRALAAAKDEKVFKLWEGLGYYTRCRNLLATAREISGDRGGVFPSTYEEIRALKGVGPYTAAAIASFAYNLPHAVVDGNVFRVLSRVFGIDTPIDSTAGKKTFTELAERLLDTEAPGLYNQAIMDFGAVVCKPLAPLCTDCPFRKTCVAFREKKTGDWPVKEKKTAIRRRTFHFLLMQDKGRVAIRLREPGDIWSGLYDFPLWEAGRSLTPARLKQQVLAEWRLDPATLQLQKPSGWYRQQLSHQSVEARFWRVEAPGAHARKIPGWKWVTPARLRDYPFPRLIRQYLDEQC